MRRLWHILQTEGAWSLVGALVLATLQWFPAWRDPSATGFGDWQMIHHNWEAAHVALFRFGEWPLWDPFHCSGVTILGNPESQVYAPLFWLSFLVGTVLASKLFLVLHTASALYGMYWLCRLEYALLSAPSAFAAIAWSLCGAFTWDGAGGHATFLSFAFAPTIVLCFRRGQHDLRWLLATAGLLALSVLEGGTYPFPYFILLIAFEFLRQLCVRKARGRLIGRTLLLLGLTLLMGAVRFLPIAVSLTHNPRAVKSGDALDLSDVLLMLTARSHAWRFPPHPYVWPEYGSYVGYAVLALALLGLLRARWHLRIGLLFFLLLMLGSRAPYYPWSLLHQLPVYDSLRVPSRFAVLFTFYLALLAGSGLHALCLRLQQLWPNRRLWPAAVLVLFLQTSDMLLVNYPIVDRWHSPPLADAATERPFYLVSGAGYHFGYASYPRQNVGTAACYIGGMKWAVAEGLWTGETPQVRVAPGEGRVVREYRTTRRVVAEVELDSEARVLFNQNAAEGWVTNVGKLASDRGRLAVDAPAGRHRIEIVYAPFWFLPSAALSGLGLLLSGFLFFSVRREAS